MENAALTVSQNVALLRRARGWTQEEFGMRIKPYVGAQWSRATVSAAEKGGRAWTANEVAAVAEIFGASVGELFELPDPCDTCNGIPPVGFICGSCGLGVEAADLHVPEEMQESLRQFAKTYASEYATQPHRAMTASAKTHGISRATAHRWALKCRQLGYLPRSGSEGAQQND